MLTRIYGTAFATKDELAEHLERLEQARARDHRKLGKELELFMFSELSPGSPFWMPNGMAIWNELTDAVARRRTPRAATARSTRRSSTTPSCSSSSGHWHVYRDNMYFTDVEGQSMGLKPMNCPAHTQLYASSRRSYRDLPIRYSEQGLVHRHEPSGTLHGLLRVRYDHAGRRAHLRHRGPDRGRGRPRARVRVRDLRALRLRAAAGALHPAGEAHRHRGDVGQGRGGAAEARSTTAASSTRSTRATARSTGRRSTCT